MKTITGICTGLLLLSLLCLCGIAAAQVDSRGTVLTDDIAPYDGPIGADSPLYGLKLALEDMDETFTANETERVDKQMEHARLRLSEVRRSLELNQNDSAQQALNNYWLKMNLTNVTISRWESNATGLLHAQEQITKHQYVLENLLASHPDNTGLQRAYNNSLALEEKFTEKTAVKYQRTIEKNNQTILKAIRLEQKDHNRTDWPGVTSTTTQTDDKLKGWEKDTGRSSGTDNTVTTVTTQAPSTNQQRDQSTNQQQDQSTNQQQGQGHQQDDNGNGNSTDKGKGDSTNK